VTGWLDTNNSGDPALWHVTHEDGDEEDLEEVELTIARCAFALGCACAPSEEEAEEWALAQDDEDDEGDQAGEEGGGIVPPEEDSEDDEDGAPTDIMDALDAFIHVVLRCRVPRATEEQLTDLEQRIKQMLPLLLSSFGRQKFGACAILD
jgi:hypothetical protein